MTSEYLRIPIIMCDRSPCTQEPEGFAGETIRQLRLNAKDNGWAYVRPFRDGPLMDICPDHKPPDAP